MTTRTPDTGGPIAPIAKLAHDDAGTCIGTIPLGGLLLIDQFASAALPPLLEARLGMLPPERIAALAYEIAAAMVVERNRLLNPTVQ